MDRMNTTEFWKHYSQNNEIISLPQDFKCSICHVVITEPYILECSHRYCLDCKNEQLKENNKKCKNCNSEFSNYSIDSNLIKFIKEISFTCLNSNECIWKGDLISFENHSNQCKFSPFLSQLIKKEKVINRHFKRSIISVNKEDICLCNRKIKSKNNILQHKEECKEFVIDCPNGCEENEVITKFRRTELNQHLKKCENAKIICNICNHSAIRKDLEKHVKENFYFHLMEMNKEVINLKKTIKKLKIANRLKNNEISKNNNEIEKFKEEIKLISQDNITKEQEIIFLKADMKKYNHHLIKMETTIVKLNSLPHTIEIDHGSKVSAILMFSENLLLTAGLGDIKYWNVNNCNLLDLIPEAHNNYIYRLIKISDVYLLSGGDDCTLKIWNIFSKLVVKTFNGHTKKITDILLLSNNRIASTSDDNFIKIWDRYEIKSIETLAGHSNSVNCIIESNENKLISGGSDNIIYFWDLGRKEPTKKLQAHTSFVLSLLKIDDSRFASGSADNTIKVWNYPSGICLRILLGHTDWIQHLILIEGVFILSASDDKSIKLWDSSSGYNLKTFTYHKDNVTRLQLLNENDLVSSSWDKKAVIWKNFKFFK